MPSICHQMSLQPQVFYFFSTVFLFLRAFSHFAASNSRTYLNETLPLFKSRLESPLFRQADSCCLDVLFYFMIWFDLYNIFYLGSTMKLPLAQANKLQQYSCTKHPGGSRYWKWMNGQIYYFFLFFFCVVFYLSFDEISFILDSVRKARHYYSSHYSTTDVQMVKRVILFNKRNCRCFVTREKWCPLSAILLSLQGLFASTKQEASEQLETKTRLNRRSNWTLTLFITLVKISLVTLQPWSKMGESY